MKFLEKYWEQMHMAASLLARMIICFALAAGQWGGAYAPWALCAVAVSGCGVQGLSAMIGSILGGLVFFPLQTALRHAAASLLLYAAALSAAERSLRYRIWFRPVLAAVSPLLVYFPAMLDQSRNVWLLYLAACLTTGLLTWRGTVGSGQDRTILLLLGFSVALMPLDIHGFSPGLVCGAWLAMLLTEQYGTHSGGVLVGLALDLSAAQPTFLLTAALGIGGEAYALFSERWQRSAAFCATAGAAILLSSDISHLADLAGLLAAGCAYLLSPECLLPSSHASRALLVRPSPCHRSAAAFRELARCLALPSPEKTENPSILFDRTAEAVCQQCAARAICWGQEYQRTYEAFNRACPSILRRGSAQRQDFPDSFRLHCIRFPELLCTINAEAYGYLLRRQNTLRLREMRQLLTVQYAQMADVLEGTVPAQSANAASEFALDAALLLRPKSGQALCGDQAASFTVGQTLYLLLSDGMGSGEAAHTESALTVRLLRQFLEAGIEPLPALKTLNTAMRLRYDTRGVFTTVDLLSIQKVSGSVALYKYGASASYVIKGGHVTRFCASALPIGLQDTEASPEITRLHLSEGMVILLTSDGITQDGDDWLKAFLEDWSGDMRSLAEQVMGESVHHRGTEDDCAVLALRAGAPPKNAAKRV